MASSAPDVHAISASHLSFSYPSTFGPAVEDVSLELLPGSRCLLLGSNGSGKSTLLRILGGRHLIAAGSGTSIRVLSRDPFSDTALTCNGELSYIGGAWQRDVAFAGNDVPLQGDFSAGEMIFNTSNVDEGRRDELIDLLDIDLNWRMHQVSDGQRRRVQLCIGLMKPFKVLFLDEITVDLDAVARADLLWWLKKECEERKVTILYATHIFDGLHTWATHFVFLSDGKLRRAGLLQETGADLSRNGTLLACVESWLRSEREAKKENEAAAGTAAIAKKYTPSFPKKHMAFFR